MTTQKKTIKDRVSDLIMLSAEPITAPQIVSRLKVDADSVYSSIRRLMSERVLTTHRVDGATTAYTWRGKSDAPRAPGRRVNVMSGDYVPSELKPFDGRPNCNQHEDYPSRMGSLLIYRDKSIQHLS